MLAKILEDMWVDPDVLEALSEEQKRILFVKMREEQVRRWRLREEEEEELRRAQSYCRGDSKKVKSKQVSWLLGRDGDVSVIVIGETDELRACKLLQSISNRRLDDRLNGAQTSPDPALDPALDPGLPDASSEDDMDLKETDSCDSDSGSGSDTLADWAPPLYRTHPRLHGDRATTITTTSAARGEGPRAEEQDFPSLESKPASGGGRVAELRKAFASKPPIPAKPLHLQTCSH